MTARCLSVGTVAGVAAFASVLSAQTPDHLPDGAGKPTVVSVCEPCHGVAVVHNTFKTRLEWEEVLEEMEKLGAQATEPQWKEISEYLLKYFSKINVNKAAAKDFETVLDIDAKVAEAIVRYRTEHGNFATLDDLKNVPGIDTKTLDARAKRLTF